MSVMVRFSFVRKPAQVMRDGGKFWKFWTQKHSKFEVFGPILRPSCQRLRNQPSMMRDVTEIRKRNPVAVMRDGFFPTCRYSNGQRIMMSYA